MPIVVQLSTEMTSIVQVIPQDTIHEIFVKVAGVNTFGVSSPLSYAEYPWYLGHVCSWWRTALLSMPPRKLRVSIQPEMSSWQAESTASMVTYFLGLNRGRQFDLDICYYCATEGCYWTDELSRIFGLLVAESAHWRHVSLGICHPCAIFGHSSCRLKHLPSMQSLRLHDTSWKAIKIPCGNCRDSFTNTPSLTHVELSLRYWDWEFDWSNLTYLHLGGPLHTYQQSIFLYLQQAINLETLITDVVVSNRFRTRITLPRLESWRAFDCNWLSFIKAPALKNLSVECRCAYDLVISFLRESGCKLARLTWYSNTENPPILSKILRFSPELVHIKLLGNIAASIESLSAPIPGVVGSDFPVPRLQSLQLDLGYYGQITDSIIDGLSKFLLFRNGQAASNGCRPAIVDRVKWLCVEDRPYSKPEKLRIQGERLGRLCIAFGVELHSLTDALPLAKCYLLLDSISTGSIAMY
jgi:hypothetical protein